MNRLMRLTYVALAATITLLLLLAALGGSGSRIFANYFPQLLIVISLVTFLLLCCVVFMGWRLYQHWKGKTFGSRMTGRMSVLMSLIATVPCLLIFFVSSQFIGRSVDSLFNTHVDRALSNGVLLSSLLLDRDQQQLLFLCRRESARLANISPFVLPEVIDRLRESGSFQSASVYAKDGSLIHQSRDADSTLPIEAPTTEQFSRSLEQNGISLLDGDTVETEDQMQMQMSLRILVPIDTLTGLQSDNNVRFLQVIQPISPEFARLTSDIVTGSRDYKKIEASREGLRNVYQIALTLSLLFAVVTAIVLSLLSAQRMTAPILQLAQGTQKVSKGTLQPIQEFEGDDELNALTKSFNSMVSQIAEAQQNVEDQRTKAEKARAYIERILENLSCGVLVLDEELNILMANAGAATILSQDLPAIGTALTQYCPELGQAVRNHISTGQVEEAFQSEIIIPSSGETKEMTLFLRGSHASLEDSETWIIVFDNMSAMIAAQRALAWGEVARRLAHEIKNPLTPIRLAAERLVMKLDGKLQGKDAELLHKTGTTIINQVDAMKFMVNDFRDYAKLPVAVLVPCDLNALLEESVELYKSGECNLILDLAKDLPAIRADATQLRQVLHNLMSNAIDATGTNPQPQIRLTTTPVIKRDRAVAVRFEVRDNGPGFAQTLLDKAFEPYVTTKRAGTGLGLPMVKKIVEDHHGKVLLSNAKDANGAICGAVITITFPLGVESET